MSSLIKPIVWAIGGADNTGGAGIQADLLSVHDFDLHCCQLVTAVTAQNSQAVNQLLAIPTDMLQAQWDALSTEMPATVIKIGMLCNDQQLDWLCSAISQLQQQRPNTIVVWDPVLSASTGGKLNSASLDKLLALAKLVDVITPNCVELAYLTGTEISSEQSLLAAAQQLLTINSVSDPNRAVIVKGGHAAWQADSVVDYLVSQQPLRRFCHPRISTAHQHGTGCTFASAMAALLAQDFNLEDSMCAALAYVSEGLASAYALSDLADTRGPVAHRGWPSRAAYLPQVAFSDAPLPTLSETFAPCCQPDLGLYPVVDSVAWIERLLKAGVKTLQLRLKDLPPTECEEQIQQAIALGKQYQAQLFINDYWQLALKHQAYGVHLGQEDLASADLNAIAKAGLRLGVSTHGFAEIARILPLKPSYIALGHIFPTKTKDMPSNPQGVSRLARYVKVVGDIPTVAIGGINMARFAPVKATGVKSIAMVTAITEAQDPEAVVATLTEQMNA